MKITTIILLLVLLIGCSLLPKPKMRPDPNPSPLDKSINFYTLLIEACGQLGYGQGACSYGNDQVIPTTDELAIYTPLGGSLALISRECGIDLVRYVSKGGRYTWPINYLFPEGVHTCILDIIVSPEIPEEFQSEVKLLGTHGQLYLRRRPKDTATSFLNWAPQIGVIGLFEGIIFGQFKATDIVKLPQLGPDVDKTVLSYKVSRGINPVSAEPIVLNITTSKPAKDGVYQLFAKDNGIGIKNQSFKGDTIVIPRSQIIGDNPTKVGPYLLYGWAVDPSVGLNDEFVVAVNVFGAENRKVAVNVYKDGDNRVCYEAENTVSAAVTFDGRWSVETSDCFDREDGKSLMIGFFTAQGRIAYSLVTSDGEIKWIH